VIRDATPFDTPRLVEMGARFLTETEYRGRVAVNPAQMTATVNMLGDSDVGHVFVLELEGLVVGMIGLLLFPHPISGDLTVSELFWWVEPEHRGRGIRLLKRAEQWARDHGAVKMHMIAPSDDVGQMYLRLGYEMLETNYQRVL
jgi:GNAT superfamily N-acetyltransferase